MGNSQGHSNEAEIVKEEKETSTCCELKRRKSKSKGVSPDEEDEEETGEELPLGNVLTKSNEKDTVNSDSNDDLAQHVTEGNVASDVTSDDQTNNRLPQQVITKTESYAKDKCISTSKIKVASDDSDSPECLHNCRERQARNVIDASNDKDGTIATKHEDGEGSVTNDTFNSSVLQEKKMKQVESDVCVQSTLHLLENRGNLEQESRTVSCTHDNICHAGVIMPETINTSTPIIMKTQHMSCHIKSPEAADNSQTLESAKDWLDLGRKPSATGQLEKQGACSVEITTVESTAKNSGAKDNSSLDVNHVIAKSSCDSGKVEETEIWNITPEDNCEDDKFANIIKTQYDKSEEEFVVIEAASNISPVKEDTFLSQHDRHKKVEKQDVILHHSLKESDKKISKDTIDDRPRESHGVEDGILTIDSATRKSEASGFVKTVNESDKTPKGEKESIIQTDDKNVTNLEANEFSDKQDSDSLKEFEETELLCLSEVEESNAVFKNENEVDIRPSAISGLSDKENMLSQNVLQSKDEPKVVESSIQPDSSDNAKLQNVAKLQYSCPVQENIINHNTSKQDEFRDVDQGCKNWEDSSRDMQYRIDSNANNEKQIHSEEYGTCSEEVDQSKITKGDESEDGTVPPPTPSSMAIWLEEEEEIEEKEGEVSNEEIYKGQMEQMVSEFGDIVCRRLSLLLESQTLLSFTDEDEIQVCENVLVASGLDEKERDYREDIQKQRKDVTEIMDEINSSLNAEKEDIVGLIEDADSVIDNLKQTDEDVINLSEIFPKLDEIITMDIEEVRVKQKKRVYLTEGVPTCNYNLSHSKLESERSGEVSNSNYVVSTDKVHSVNDRDKCLSNEFIKQDMEIKETSEEISESSDIHAITSSGVENKHNYLLSDEEAEVVEVMDALDDVIDEAYLQVFTKEKEESFREVDGKISTTHTTDQMKDEQNTKSREMKEIDPTENKRREPLEDKEMKEIINNAALMSVSAKSSKFEEGCKNVKSRVNAPTLADSITMQELSPDDTATTPIGQEPTLSLKIKKMEEAPSRAQTVDEINDRTPTAESFPELTALTEMASAAVDNLVQYQPSGRRSVSCTESDLDISEQRDDLSTEGMYADDEDDETMEILFTRTYTEPKQGTEAFVSCTVVNSAYRQANRGGSFLQYAVPDTLDLLEGSIEVMPPSFIKAKKEMRDIQVHLQSLRKQMEHFHDDIDESSLPDLDYLSPDPQPRRAITD